MILLSLLLAWQLTKFVSRPNSYPDFACMVEYIYPVIPLVLCCFILSDNDQNELFLSYKIRLTKLFFTDFFFYYFAMAIPLIVFYFGICPNTFDKPASLFIPYLISCLITSMFLMSATILFRLAIRNNYASVGFIFLTVIVFNGEHYNLYSHTMSANLRRYYVYIDPYISHLTVCDNVWYINRLILLAASSVFLITSFILLKKEIINKN
ncbi:MAG TPA: hypothetical protein VHO90_08750 [Bacteroidales bacterium]|nr:hypothetical protein [Bacteroidales bacterium]